MRSTRGVRRCITLFAVLATIPALAQEAPIAHFTEPAEQAVTVPEGHLMLRWSVAGAEAGGVWEFQLEQTFGENFSEGRTAYSGPDRGTFVSGLPADGASFRVRARSQDAPDANWGPWSKTLQVSVNYPPRWQVLVLGSAGLLMFAVLFGTVVTGSARARRQRSSSSTT